MADDAQKALDEGCDACISKPINNNELYRLIEKNIYSNN